MNIMRNSSFWIALLALVTFACSAASEELSDQWTQDWPNTNFSKHTVDLSEINSTDIPKDGIPSISRPRFVSIKKAKKWLGENEPVMVAVIDDVARAYPLQILIYHQIVNDTIKGQPVLVTFCPLCNSGLVLSRKVDSKTLTFGTTGKLRNSGLIMYDRQTQSWWQQFTGTGIVGEYSGKKLSFDHNAQIISFAQFAQRHPKSKVLSKDTGFRRKYGLNPFQGYDSIDSSPFLFPDETDPRLPAMERVLNIRFDNAHKLYPYGTIEKIGVINDAVGDTPVVVLSGAGYVSPLDQTEIVSSTTVPLAIGYSRNVDGTLLTFQKKGDDFIDKQTGSKWTLFGEAISGSLKGAQLRRVDSGNHFAFAALAFTPDAEVYTDPEAIEQK